MAAIGGGRITVAQRSHIIHTWPGHTGTVLQMLVMDKLLLSLGSDRYLKVWQMDVRSSTPVVRSCGHLQRPPPFMLTGHLAAA